MCLSLLFSTLFINLKQGVSLGLEFTNWLKWRSSKLRISVSSHSLSTRVTDGVDGCWRSKLMSSHLYRKHFTQRATPPAPGAPVFIYSLIKILRVPTLWTCLHLPCPTLKFYVAYVFFPNAHLYFLFS